MSAGQVETSVRVPPAEELAPCVPCPMSRRIDALRKRWSDGVGCSELLAESAVLMADRSMSPRNQIRLQLSIAAWEAASDARDAAVATAYECRRQALALGELHVAAWATLQMARSTLFSGADRDELVAAIDESAQMFDGLRLDTGAAQAHLLAGIALLFTMNDPQRALARLMLARDRRSSLTCEFQGYVFGCQAIALGRLGMVDQAALALREGVALRVDKPESSEDAVLRLAAGVIALAQGERTHAIENLEKAVGVADRCRMMDLRAEVLRVLAHSYGLVGDRQAAQRTVARWRIVKSQVVAAGFTDAWWLTATLGEWSVGRRAVTNDQVLNTASSALADPGSTSPAGTPNHPSATVA
jgi:tetratricopeptide (TPR) repeat protein